MRALKGYSTPNRKLPVYTCKENLKLRAKETWRPSRVGRVHGALVRSTSGCALPFRGYETLHLLLTSLSFHFPIGKMKSTVPSASWGYGEAQTHVTLLVQYLAHSKGLINADYLLCPSSSGSANNELWARRLVSNTLGCPFL